MLSSTLALLALAHAARASVSLTFDVQHAPPKHISVSQNSKAPGDSSEFDFGNLNDVATGADIYVATIQAGGQSFVVQLDTGSSDLWLDTSKADTSQFTSTGQSTGILYGDGTVAQGPILIGNVEFGGFTVPQAFISAPGSNATTNGDTGLLGVGPPGLSQINDQLQGTQFNGKTVLENIFDANPSEPNVITFQLSRSQTTGTTSGGIFTIGEADSNFQNVTSAPKLPVVSANRWVVLMDGIIVNGKNFSGNSQFRNIEGQTAGQTLANLDSGTTFSAIPLAYGNAIYGSVPGSQFLRDQGLYVLPCDTVINLSFVFGGVEYPVHPIDTVAAGLADDGSIACFSGFPVGDAGDSEDLLLGDSFLRNVYSLFDFGSFTGNGTTTPFVQMVGLTDAQAASAEFNTLSSQRNNTLKSGDTLPPTATPSGGSGGSGNGAVGAGVGAGAGVVLPMVVSAVGVLLASAVFGI